MRKFLTPQPVVRSSISTEEADTVNAQKKTVFLGGTVNDTSWRDKLIPMLTCGYYNPVVAEWTEQAIRDEDEAKDQASVLLFVITPAQAGLYSIAEMAVSACHPEQKRTVIAFLDKDGGDTFDEHERKSNKAIIDLLTSFPNTVVFNNLEDIAKHLNEYLK